MRIIEESQERSSFRVDIEGLAVADRTIDLAWEFTIEAGTHGYRASITPSGLRGGEELLVGIVNLHSDTLYLDDQPGRFAMYTHGPQAELDHYLGMALSVDEADFVDYGEFKPDDQPISSTYYIRAKLNNGRATTYHFTAGWAPGFSEFKSREKFAAVIL